jgi:hypothetical protein
MHGNCAVSRGNHNLLAVCHASVKSDPLMVATAEDIVSRPSSGWEP